MIRPKANEERDSSIICLSIGRGDESEINEAGNYKSRFFLRSKFFANKKPTADYCRHLPHFFLLYEKCNYGTHRTGAWFRVTKKGVNKSNRNQANDYQGKANTKRKQGGLEMIIKGGRLDGAGVTAVNADAEHSCVEGRAEAEPVSLHHAAEVC